MVGVTMLASTAKDAVLKVLEDIRAGTATGIYYRQKEWYSRNAIARALNNLLQEGLVERRFTGTEYWWSLPAGTEAVVDEGVGFRCGLCDAVTTFSSVQKGVGAGWRKANFNLWAEDSLWYCPHHVQVGEDLNKTILQSVETLKRDIVLSVRDRVMAQEAKR